MHLPQNTQLKYSSYVILNSGYNGLFKTRDQFGETILHSLMMTSSNFNYNDIIVTINDIFASKHNIELIYMRNNNGILPVVYLFNNILKKIITPENALKIMRILIKNGLDFITTQNTIYTFKNVSGELLQLLKLFPNNGIGN